MSAWPLCHFPRVAPVNCCKMKTDLHCLCMSHKANPALPIKILVLQRLRVIIATEDHQLILGEFEVVSLAESVQEKNFAGGVSILYEG